MSTGKNSSKVKFINPPNRLKMKAGHGGIPDATLQQAQEVINTYKTDFKPEAQKMGEALQAATASALEIVSRREPFDKNAMLYPIMQLKANGGMFQYQLLSDVADICLQFMETVNDYNAEAIDIIKAHENAINIIIKSDLKGDGGQEGYILVQELHRACNRFFKKYNV